MLHFKMKTKEGFYFCETSFRLFEFESVEVWNLFVKLALEPTV